MKDEEWLQEQQIALEDVVGAYGYNMCAACPSLGGQYFPLNVLPIGLFIGAADMGWGCGTPLWYNPGSCCCGTSAGPLRCCGCCVGAAQPFDKDDANWGSPNLALRSQFEQELSGEEMARELAMAESESAFRCRFILAGCVPSLEKQKVHLNGTWAKDVNERLLKPAGYYCVLHDWTLSSGGRQHESTQSSHLQLLIVKGEAAPTTTTMPREGGVN